MALQIMRGDSCYCGRQTEKKSKPAVICLVQDEHAYSPCKLSRGLGELGAVASREGRRTHQLRRGWKVTFGKKKGAN